MNSSNNARLHTRLQQALCLLTLAVLLMGCNLEAHESVDNHAPGNNPMPQNAKPTVKALPKPVPPPPTEAEMGMPIYPNATTYIDALGNPIPSLTKGESKQAILSTPDSMDKVVEFYKSRLTETDASGASKPVTPREMPQNGKNSTVLTGNDAAGNILMAIIYDNSGKTTIELMHTHTETMPSSVSGDSKSGSAKPDDKLPSTTQAPSTSLPDQTRP